MTRALCVRLALACIAAIVMSSCGGSAPPATTSPIAQGEMLATRRGCAACHSANGNVGVGPTWKGLAGETVTLSDGSQVVADAAYLTRSIRDPSAQVVRGFTTQMPQLALVDSEIAALVAYIESLR